MRLCASRGRDRHEVDPGLPGSSLDCEHSGLHRNVGQAARFRYGCDRRCRSRRAAPTASAARPRQRWLPGPACFAHDTERNEVQRSDPLTADAAAFHAERQLYSRLSEMPCRRATSATLPPCWRHGEADRCYGSPQPRTFGTNNSLATGSEGTSPRGMVAAGEGSGSANCEPTRLQHSPKGSGKR